LLLVETGELVSGLHEVDLGSFVGVVCSAQVEFLDIGDFGEFSGPFLQLIEVVVSGLDLGVTFGIFALFEAV